MKSMFAVAPLAAAAAGSWEWVDIEGSVCMNGKQTGIWTKTGSQKSLGVYLYGGGACFNAETCAVAVTTDPKPGNPGSSGIFDSRSDNPLHEYNWIAVPYCTGDVHSGEDDKNFAGGERHFHGAPNLKLMMTWATKNFKEVDTLFITGESAGGFGAAASYPLIRDFYPSARGVLMDDSGPVLDDEALPACLQKIWRSAWNLNKNLPSDCSCNNDSGNLVSIWSYIKDKYPKDSVSLISSQTDSTISAFFAYSRNNCHALIPVGYDKLLGGLQRLAKSSPVYIIPGSVHTHTSQPEFYSRVVNGVALYQWIGQLVDADQADPESVEPTAQDILHEMFNTSFFEKKGTDVLV